jgi:hypothetical protein
MVVASGKPNAWYVNKELACLWQTRVLLVFEPMWKPFFNQNWKLPLLVMSSFFMVDKWETPSFPVMDVW